MKVLVAAALGLVLVTTPALAQGKKSQVAGPDQSDAPVCDAVPEAGASTICRCETGPASGSVWGSGPYTADSSICTAARHAGVIGADGGAVQLVGLPGAESYEGTEANGVITSNWGSYGESFDVQPAGVAVATPEQVDAPVCASVPEDGMSLVCRCSEGPTTGSVWGSGPYTADSDICTAARHAGHIGAQGGVVQLAGWPGQDAYEGSNANGVTTSSWGSYGQSFMVAAASASVAMPEQAGPACDVMPGGAEQYSCVCSAGIRGSVWGSGPYTADSNICSAARHAGVVGAAGGEVKVLRVPGLAVYAGTDANGETTAGWDSYDSSIVFDRN